MVLSSHAIAHPWGTISRRPWAFSSSPLMIFLPLHPLALHSFSPILQCFTFLLANFTKFHFPSRQFFKVSLPSASSTHFPLLSQLSFCFKRLRAFLDSTRIFPFTEGESLGWCVCAYVKDPRVGMLQQTRSCKRMEERHAAQQQQQMDTQRVCRYAYVLSGNCTSLFIAPNPLGSFKLSLMRSEMIA